MEVRALLSSSQISRRHGALQNALAATMYLNRLVQPCKDLGIDISAAVQLESASVLWDQGEMAASINMLQDLKAYIDPRKQAIHVGKPELLAKLVHILVQYSYCNCLHRFRATKFQKQGWRNQMRSSASI